MRGSTAGGRLWAAWALAIAVLWPAAVGAAGSADAAKTTAAHAVAAAQPASRAKAPAVQRVAAHAGQAAPYTADELAAHARARQSAIGVAALHPAKKGKEDAQCASCHGPRIVLTDNQVRENQECRDCHGDYAALAAEAAKKKPAKAIDPHASHLGPEVACTACHSGHQPSKAYCEHCHTNFQMPMPGNRPPAK